jgi:hypothetical protein
VSNGPGEAKKAAKKAAGAAKKAAPKKLFVLKLSPTQAEMLKKVAGHSGHLGYLAENKSENKTLEALLKYKLIKKGKKDAASGNFHYQVTKAGQKYLSASPSSASAHKLS